MTTKQDAQFAIRGIAARVLYRARCAGCGKSRLHPFFSSGPQFCNADCEQAWRDMQAGR